MINEEGSVNEGDRVCLLCMSVCVHVCSFRNTAGTCIRKNYEHFFFSRSSQQVKEDVKRIDIGKEAAIEAEVKAARERAIVPLEIRMKQFRDLLAEKGVRLLFLFHSILLICGNITTSRICNSSNVMVIYR